MRPVLLWLAFLIGFCVMAAFAASYDTFPADVWLAHRLQEVDGAAFRGALDVPEALADLPLVLAVWLPAVALLWLLRQPGRALLLVVAPLGWVINSGVKALVERPRPSPGIVAVTDHSSSGSFPSGHAITAFLIFGLLLYFATLLVRPAPLRLALQVACLYGIAFTGLARVYHGAHWPSDVLGGFYLGALVLAVLVAFDRLVLSQPVEVTYPRLPPR